MDTGRVLTVGALPWQLLPASSRVDVLGLVSGARPAVRLHHGLSCEAVVPLARWAEAAGLAAASDSQYTVIAGDWATASMMLAVDRDPSRHEAKLGRLLGYPRCCVAAIAEVGEVSIDAASARAAAWEFSDELGLIDVAQYRQGVALVSHVPCSPWCRESLAQALSVRAFLLSVSLDHAGEPWTTWRAARDWSSRRLARRSP